MSNRVKQTDKYYQSFTVNQVSLGSNARQNTLVNIPKPLAGYQSKDRALVMELMKVERTGPDMILTNNVSVYDESYFSLVNPDLMTLLQLREAPTTFVKFWRKKVQRTATQTDVTYEQEQMYKDFVLDGRGLLVPGDKFWIASQTNGNTGASHSASFVIYYRFIEIPLLEYLGMIQSQAAAL